MDAREASRSVGWAMYNNQVEDGNRSLLWMFIMAINEVVILIVYGNIMASQETNIKLEGGSAKSSIDY